MPMFLKRYVTHESVEDNKAIFQIPVGCAATSVDLGGSPADCGPADCSGAACVSEMVEREDG